MERVGHITGVPVSWATAEETSVRMFEGRGNRTLAHASWRVIDKGWLPQPALWTGAARRLNSY